MRVNREKRCSIHHFSFVFNRKKLKCWEKWAREKQSWALSLSRSDEFCSHTFISTNEYASFCENVSAKHSLTNDQQHSFFTQICTISPKKIFTWKCIGLPCSYTRRLNRINKKTSETTFLKIMKSVYCCPLGWTNCVFQFSRMFATFQQHPSSSLQRDVSNACFLHKLR